MTTRLLLVSLMVGVVACAGQPPAPLSLVPAATTGTADVTHRASAVVSNRPTMALAARPSASAPVEPGDPADVVMGLHPQFQACFDQALELDPGAGGVVVFDLLLSPAGRVASITPKSSRSYRDGELSKPIVECVEGVLLVARFRPPAGGVETHVEIPVQFRPRLE